jgi:UDP-glucuronate decarboxylase
MTLARMQATWEADVAAIAARDLPWHQLSGARVLVTGAGGFLGGYLARTLLGLHALGQGGRTGAGGRSGAQRRACAD